MRAGSTGHGCDRHDRLPPMSRRDLCLLIILSAVWGASFLFYRIAAPLVGPIVLAEGRTLIASVALVPLLRRQHWSAIARLWKPLLLLGLVNGALPYSMIAYAQITLTAPVASILNASTAIFTGIIAFFVLHESLPPKRVAGLAIGVVGVAVVVGLSGYSPTHRFWLAVGAMTLASLSYAIAGVFSGRLKGEQPLVLATGQLLFGSALLGPLTVSRIPKAHFTGAAVWSMLALGLLSTAFAYVLYFRLIASAGPTNTLSLTLIVPVFGTFWSWLFRGESITIGAAVGALIIAVGVILVTGIRLPSRFIPTKTLR